MNKEFEVGQRWLMRNGQVAEVVRINADRHFAVMYRFGQTGVNKSVSLQGIYAEGRETPYDLVELLHDVPELTLDDYLRMSRNDLIEQAQRFIEIADSVAAKRNWESVVKLKMLYMQLQQVIEQEGTL